VIGHSISAHKYAKQAVDALAAGGVSAASGPVSISAADRAAIVADVVEALKGLHLQP
jgi:hypothetical protein